MPSIRDRLAKLPGLSRLRKRSKHEHAIDFIKQFPGRAITSTKKLYYAVLHWIKNNRFVSAIVAIFTILYSILDITRYNNFINGYDFGIFHQIIWHYSRFEPARSSFRNVENVLGDHFHPILMTLVPAYWVFPSPYTLIIAQALLAGLAAIPLYIYARRRVGYWSAIMLSMALLLHAGVQHAVYFEFHETAFVIPLVALNLLAIETKRWRWFWFSTVLLLLTREEMAIYLIGVSAFLLIRRELKRALITFGLATITYAVLSSIIMPRLAGAGKYMNYWRFEHYGTDPANALANAFANPIHTAKQVVKDLIGEPIKRDTFEHMFKPLLFILPVVSPFFIIAMPLILIRMLANWPPNWEYQLHYWAPLSPILFFGVVDTIGRFIDRYPTSMLAINLRLKRNILPRITTPRRRIIAAIVAGTVLAMSLHDTYFYRYPLVEVESPDFYKINQQVRIGEGEALALVPANASVIAQMPIIAKLANRENAFILFNPAYQAGPGDNAAVRTPLTADYLVVNTAITLDSSWTATYSSRLGSYPSTFPNQFFVDTVTQTYGYKVIHNKDGWIVMQKIPSPNKTQQ